MVIYQKPSYDGLMETFPYCSLSFLSISPYLTIYSSYLLPAADVSIKIIKAGFIPSFRGASSIAKARRGWKFCQGRGPTDCFFLCLFAYVVVGVLIIYLFFTTES